MRTRSGWWLWPAVVVCVVAAVLFGRYPTVGFVSVGRLIEDPLMGRILWQLRLPRVLAAALVGLSLGAAGWTFQTVFSNPLVEPGFLAVSPGAAFGAAVAIVFAGGHPVAVQALALLAALVGLAGAFWLARRIAYGGWVTRLVIAGIAVSAFFSAGLGVVKYLADPTRQLPELTFWLLGGLHTVTWQTVARLLPLTGAGLLVVVAWRWRLNLLALDDRTAFSIGSRPGVERTIVLTAAAAAVAAVTAVAGIIGWVGLIVPHVVRRRWGGDSRRSLPKAMAVGAAAVVLCDTLARGATSAEIPLGILTALFGSLLFVVLMVGGTPAGGDTDAT